MELETWAVEIIGTRRSRSSFFISVGMILNRLMVRYYYVINVKLKFKTEKENSNSWLWGRNNFTRPLSKNLNVK